MNAHDFAAEEHQVRKKAGLWIGGCLLATAVLWLLGAPRFALFSAVFAFPFAVLGWGPSERRIQPTPIASARTRPTAWRRAIVVFGIWPFAP
jgi:hypothetical protein